MEFDLNAFSRRLQQLIIQNGETAADVAKNTGVAKSTMSRYLSGKRSPDIECIVKLASHFGVSLEYITGLSDDDKVTASPEMIWVAKLYGRASREDRQVVDLILSKYKEV